jgi:hypothetical protein
MSDLAFPKPVRAKLALKDGQHRRKPIQPSKWQRTPAKSAAPKARGSAKRIARTPHAGDNPARVAWLHTQPCAGRVLTGHVCSGPMTVNHERVDVGVGQRASDNRTHAACLGLHVTGDGMANLAGPMTGWTREDLRRFVAGAIADADRRWASYSAFAAALPCCASHLGDCSGDVSATVAGFPMCSGHGEDWLRRCGVFAGWRNPERFAWADERLVWAAKAWRDGRVPNEAPVGAEERLRNLKLSREYCEADSSCRDVCVHERARAWLRRFGGVARRAGHSG